MYAAPAKMLSRGSKGSAPRPCRARNSVQVFGMICIRPMAPLDDRARWFAPLSTCITARIQCSGTAKRLDASLTKAAKGWRDLPLARYVGGDARPACAAPFTNIDDARTITKHTVAPRDRKAAIVPATVKGEAPARRPEGRP